MSKDTDPAPAPRAASEANALKALAHPDRMRILGILRFDGPDTASGLARRMGLNSGATSYHLRQLEKQGFIEHATDLGNRRERWWRARQEVPVEEPSDGAEGGMAAVEGLIAQHMALMQRALRQFPEEQPDWQAASNVSDYTYVMTAEQARVFKEKLTALLWDEMRRSRPADGPPPPGTKQFMVMLHAFPFPGYGETGED